MNFQTLREIETPARYLDRAFGEAKKKAAMSLQEWKKKHARRQGAFAQRRAADERKHIEEERLRSVEKRLTECLRCIITGMPRLEQLTPFYQELTEITIQYAPYRHSLGAVGWALTRIWRFSRHFCREVRKAPNEQHLVRLRTQYYGRIASVLKQIAKELSFLEQARRTMKAYPVIKAMPTVSIVGLPNVGKTTLFFKLTGSKPEIAPYAFTTKSLNIGYMELTIGELNSERTGLKKIQVIDTPGALGRLEKMNTIERQASLALKHCADIVVYVFDVTEPYPLEQQEKLYTQIKKLKKPMLVYVSKGDMLGEKAKAFAVKKKGVVDGEEVKEKIVVLMREMNAKKNEEVNGLYLFTPLT